MVIKIVLAISNKRPIPIDIPMRLYIVSDIFSTEWTKNINKIEMIKIKKTRDIILLSLIIRDTKKVPQINTNPIPKIKS